MIEIIKRLFKDPVEVVTENLISLSPKNCLKQLALLLLATLIGVIEIRFLNVPYQICLILGVQLFSLVLQYCTLLAIRHLNKKYWSGCIGIFFLALFPYYVSCILCFPVLFLDALSNKYVSEDYGNSIEWKITVGLLETAIFTIILFLSGIYLLDFLNYYGIPKLGFKEPVVWMIILIFILVVWGCLLLLSNIVFKCIERRIDSSNTESVFLMSFSAEEAYNTTKLSYYLLFLSITIGLLVGFFPLDEYISNHLLGISTAISMLIGLKDYVRPVIRK